MPIKNCLVDCEGVVFNDFWHFYLFDLLYIYNNDITEQTYNNRYQLLINIQNAFERAFNRQQMVPFGIYIKQFIDIMRII